MLRGGGIALVVLLVLCGAAGPAQAQAPRQAEVLAESVSANCRNVGALRDPQCETPLSPRVTAAAVDAFEGSWVHRALALQERLARDVGLRKAPFVGTHNSFNSVAEMGLALSANDANQQLTLVDQLRLGVRSLELDVHWFPRLQELGRAPVVCHATGEHGGCSTEKPLGPVLEELAGWLGDHRDEVLLLYIEDHLDDEAGYARGAAVVEEELGDVLFRPPGGGEHCEELPLDLTRQDILDAGAQVIVMTSCGVGTAWPAIGFDGSAREEARPVGFTDFPGCGTRFDRATYEATIVRYYEDSTAVTATASLVGAASRDDGITPRTAARMARCGVDLLGLDQLLPEDGRLEALVWSWAPGEPRSGVDCAIQRAGGRWEARTCKIRRPVACRAPDGSWVVPAMKAGPREAPARCRAEGAVFAVPRTGYEGQLLLQAMEEAGVSFVTLGLRRDGHWLALDER